MQFCPACGVSYQNGVFYASSVVRNPDNTIQKDEDGNAVRIYNIPFNPSVQYTRICQYSKRPGCLNTCTKITPSETFEARSQALNTNTSVEKWLDVARDLLKHD